MQVALKGEKREERGQRGREMSETLMKTLELNSRDFGAVSIAIFR